jgi:HK97 family phage portal protein
MALLSDLIPRTETRAEKYLTGGAELMLRQATSTSGVAVTERTAMTFSAVHLAVRVISETLGSLPIRVYQTLDKSKGRRLASELDADYLIHVRPNPFQTPMQFKEMLTAHVVLRGFAVARKIFNSAGKIIALIPIHPSSVEIGYRKNYEIFFKITHTYLDENGFEKSTVEILFQNEVLHIMGLALGHYPVSPIRMHAETIGVGLATRDYKGSFFANSAMPSGILKHPGFFREDQEEEIERLRKEFKEKFTGGNRFSTMVLQHGMEWEQLGMTNSDAELIKSQQFNVLEIARAFRIQPHKLMQLEDASRANVEQMAIEHVVDTLRPWAVRIEEAISRDLLSEKQKKEGYHSKYSMDALLRGDTEARHKAYSTGRQWGYLSINDIRHLEDLTPLDPEVGDVYLSPVNMINAAIAGREQEQLPEIEGESPQANRSKTAIESILNSSFSKLIERGQKNFKRFLEKEPEISNWIEDFRKKETDIAESVLNEIILPLSVLANEDENKIRSIVLELKDFLPQTWTGKKSKEDLIDYVLGELQ